MAEKKKDKAESKKKSSIKGKDIAKEESDVNMVNQGILPERDLKKNLGCG